jgi:hypothetical protein
LPNSQAAAPFSQVFPKAQGDPDAFQAGEVFASVFFLAEKQ